MWRGLLVGRAGQLGEGRLAVERGGLRVSEGGREVVARGGGIFVPLWKRDLVWEVVVVQEGRIVG